MNAEKDCDKDWYKYCRICLEWLNPKRGLDPEKWVVEVVERAQSLNIDTLAFDLYHGGYSIFNQSVAPKDRHIGNADVLALLDRELHKRDMKLVIMNMGAHCASYMSKEYPQWRIVNEEGQNVEFFPAYLMCINTPYANFLLQELAELLPRYQIDGIYIEGLYGAFGIDNECYCAHCRTEFKKIYGFDMPPVGEKSTRPEFKQFRANVVTNFIRRVRKVIDEKSPDTVFMPCPSFYSFSDFEAWGKYADAITLERQWGYMRDETDLFETGLSMQVIRALSGRPTFGTLFLAWTVDRNYAPSTPQHYRLNFGEILLYGGTPQLHAQTIFEVDRSETTVVREMYDLMEEVRPALLNAHLVRYAALVVDWTDFQPTEHFKGFYKALIEKHIPFEVISRNDLKADILQRYKVVLLPNIIRLSDKDIEEIQAFNSSGGGVVMTFLTGCHNMDGSLRNSNPLLELAGVSGPFGVETNPLGSALDLSEFTQSHFIHSYYHIVKEHDIGSGTVNRLQSVTGSFAEVELTNGTAIAEVLDYDYSKMHRHHPVMGWYPGRPISPLIVANEAENKGRVVYFAAEFDRATYKEGLPGTIDTLAQAAVWSASALPPVELKVSPTVEAATHFSPEDHTYTVIMVNQTTNQLRPGMVVRHVEPLMNTEIILREIKGEIESVRAIKNNCLEYSQSEDVCSIRLKVLDEYEAIIIRLKT